VKFCKTLNKKLIMKRFLIIFLISAFGFISQSFAQGGLLITPKRVVFEGAKQKAELSLMNTGADTATFSVSFRQYNMSEDGKLVLNEKPDSTEMFADPFLRVFPRKVTLAPGEGQNVILQLRRKADMKDGEYRSHLWFRDEKDYSALAKKDTSKLDSNQLSVSVIAVYGMTIPIIIRNGEVNTGATLSDIHLDMQDSVNSVKLTINRIGDISISGKLSIEYVPISGKPTQVGMVNLAIYTTITKRYVTVKLNNTQGLDLAKGKLKVSFSSTDDAVKKEIYSVSELELH
jgi:hypothetical protein